MNLSVEKAKQIREDIGATFLVVFAMDAEGNDNVSTHGQNEQQAHEAANFGNRLKTALGWPADLCQSTPAQRVEWQRKTATEIMADVERLLQTALVNQEKQEKLSNERWSLPLAERQGLERQLARLKRENEDLIIRLHTLEWMLRPAADDDVQVGVLTIARAQLSTAAAYANMVDSLTQYGGGTSNTGHDLGLPVDGIFRVWREHYDPDAEPNPEFDYTGDSDDQTNNVRVELAFAVDFGRQKLVLADAEYDLVEGKPEWTDTECWVVEGDGFEQALCVYRFTAAHHPAEEVGVCFLAECEG